MNSIHNIGEAALLQYEGDRQLAYLFLRGLRSLGRRVRTYVDLTLLGTRAALARRPTRR